MVEPEEKEWIVLKDGRRIARREAMRLIKTIDTLNPDLTPPRRKLYVDISLFLLGLALLAHYFVLRGSFLLPLIGAFWAMFGTKGIKGYRALKREVKELRGKGDPEELRSVIEEIKEALGQP